MKSVQEKIVQACRRVGRDPSEIILVAVTKYTTLEKIRQAIEAGVEHIGENKVQDAENHFNALGADARHVTKHMIGHLQTNKVKKALELFGMIQTVDSQKLAVEIEKQAARLDRTVDVLIEVNTSGEEQKFGITRDAVAGLAEKIAGCPHIRLRGFMTMAPYTDDTNIIRKCFKDLKILSGQIAQRFQEKENIEIKYLSMGMSHDFEIAIEEGANMVRIGTAIFQD